MTIDYKRTIKYLLSFIFTLTLFISLKISTYADDAKINVMIYMVGSNLESEDKCGTEDINEIIAGTMNSNEDVNVFVYGGGAKHWYNDIFSNQNNKCVLIRGNDVKTVYEEAPADMTKSDTLTRFISTCAEKYPAEKNILVMWDHGGGAIFGFGYDENYPSSLPMPFGQIRNAVNNSNVKIDMVGFDACLMSSVEMCLFMGECADYLVASECIEPSSGWDYEAWIGYISQNPDADTVTISKKAADAYMAEYENYDGTMQAAMTVTDLKYFINNVPDALGDFSNDLSDSKNLTLFLSTAKSRGDSVEVVRLFKFDCVDAIDFIDGIDIASAERLSEQLKKSIIYNKSTREADVFNGLSLYVPFRSTAENYLNADTLSIIESTGVSKSYINWLENFVKYINYAQDASNKERTFFDVLFGSVVSNNETEGLEAKLKKIINRNLVHDEMYKVTTDEKGNLKLDIPEDELDLIINSYQRVYRNLNGQELVYGMVDITPESRTLHSDEFWSYMYNSWFHINGTPCPIYVDSVRRLSSTSTSISCYVPARYNDETGFLIVSILYDDIKNSADINIELFMHINTQKINNLCDRYVLASDFADGSEIEIIAYLKTEDVHDVETVSTGVSWKWGEDVELDWLPITYSGQYSREVCVEDIYGNFHLIDIDN